MATMEKTVRQFKEEERRLLSWALAWRKRRVKSLHRRIIVIALALFAVFSGAIIIATIADKKGPSWYYACLIGAGIAFPIALWSYLSIRAKFIAGVHLFESALRRGEACVTRIQSDAMVEFEEEEDEGACYAFQLKDRQIVFISGQEFYPSARFPNTDFSLVTVHGNEGVLAARFIEKNGTKLKALKQISAWQKSRLRIPDNMEIVEGNVDQIEQVLSSDG
jgi:hypothetical protein